MRSFAVVVSLAALVTGVLYLRPAPDLGSSPSVPPSLDTAGATQLLNRQPGIFVPNLGQWEHPARFVHRSGPMTVFVKDRGWVLDLVEQPAKQKTEPHAVHQGMPGDRDVEQKTRGAALQMTFEGGGRVPEIVGEKKLPGHHNYFLGNDETRWRSHVPLYASVCYENLYPGVDLRLREANGVPEYDLLLERGADLSLVPVHVEGGQGLSIAKDGSLVIETALGPLTQSVPETWQVGRNGRKREVACKFTLLDADRFGFAAPGWDGDTSLTIDPGLIWSTFLGGNNGDVATALSVDASGVVTVAGDTGSTNFPTTKGAYDTTWNSNYNVFVSRLDPSRTGSAQLVYSTFLGGKKLHHQRAAFEPIASGLADATTAAKTAAIACGKHEAKRKAILTTWEKQNADLVAERSRAKSALDEGRRAVAAIAKLDRELAAARAGTTPAALVLTDSQRTRVQQAEADLHTAAAGLKECSCDRARLKGGAAPRSELMDGLGEQSSRRRGRR